MRTAGPAHLVDRLAWRPLDMAWEEFEKKGYLMVEPEIFIKEKRHRHFHQRNKWVYQKNLIGMGLASYGFFDGISYFNERKMKNYQEKIRFSRLPPFL